MWCCIYQFTWPLCKKKCNVGCIMNATKPQVIKNKICEGTDPLKAALRSGMTSLQMIVAFARSVGWGSNEAVPLLYLITWPSTPTYRVKTHDSKHVSHYWPDSIKGADRSLLSLLFLRSLSIVLGCPVINSRYHQDRKLSWIVPMAYHPRTGFHYS